MQSNNGTFGYGLAALLGFLGMMAWSTHVGLKLFP
jgi:hypothetical protein